MTAMSYSYEIAGLAADEQTWTAKGTVSVARQGEFMTALSDAMRGGFEQLTMGKAVFGKPGVGCRGPYTVTRFSIEAVRD